MLLELTDDLVRTDASADDVHALEQILLARRMGYHLLWGSSELFRSLEQLTYLSPKAVAILRKARNRLGRKREFVEELAFRIRVSYDSEPTIDCIDGVTIITLRLRHFLSIGAAGPAVILGENRMDAAFLREMARVFAATTRARRVKMRCRLAGGGGSTTPEAFAGFRDDPRFCVCVVDSDAQGPIGSDDGGTGGVFDEIDPLKPWAAAMQTPYREAENALPTRIVQEAVRRDSERLEQIPDLEQLEARPGTAKLRDFVDIKDGTTLGWVLSLPQGPIRDFWIDVMSAYSNLPGVNSECVRTVSCLAEDDCSCWIVPDFGSRLLEHGVACLQQMTGHKIAEALCDVTRPHWSLIGGVVFSWACGTEQTVV